MTFKRLFLVSLILVMVTGCGGPYDASVKGVLLLDGSPVSTGTVTFYPQGGGAPAYAQVQEDGSFVARTGDANGLPSGNYEVSVRVVERIEAEKLGDPPRFKNLIPVRYKNPKTSGLAYELSSGRNQIEVSLESE
ncbi:MAG: hypothetical protein AAGF97_17670 [Planctomycetota bacterium]